MTNKTEWKMAKWVKKHPNAKRKDLPKRFPNDLPGGRYRFFRVECVKSDSEGYQIQDPEDIFKMTDSDLDAYIANAGTEFTSSATGWSLPVL